MGYGKWNDIALQIMAQGQFAGTGAEADTNATSIANHIKLPFRARLVRVDATGYAGAALAAAAIQLYQGTSKSGTAVLTTALDLSGDGAYVNDSVAPSGLVNGGKIYDKGTEFCISQNMTNTKTLDQLQVTLTFRKEQVED